ncbi:glycosyltransferase [Halobellus salinisoli]|uniref:glycosyltransferase n=1 Tax=Halobellus salinisoli TaxID=3108500 RepID=UPI003CE5BAC4
MAPPTSVLLPTNNRSPVIEELTAQLTASDELLIICDDETAPVAEHVAESPNTRLVIAGDPSGCSGKANAVAAGVEAAANDRIVWTDDDFEHPPDWLADLHRDYEQRGPVTELPFFVGRDPLATLLEPIYAIGGTFGTYQGDIVWGGAVMFDRDDIDVDSFLRDLRRSVSDDGILTEYLDVTPLRRTRIVPMGGSLRDTAERHVRFTQIVRWHDPAGFAVMSAIGSLSTVGALLYPLPALILLTLIQLGIYMTFGVRRWTFLLAYPATLVQVPLFAYALSRRTFVWGGRRYRWRSKFDVEIVE